MKKIIEIFPKNKNINNILLSKLQLSVREDEIKIKHKKTKRCSKCGNELPITEFYPKYFSYSKKYKGKKKIKRYDCACKDCRLKDRGVVEIGRVRFAKKIFKKGFRRCSVCKEIKPLTEYSKSISRYGGYSNNCYECSNKLHNEFIKNQKNEIGDFYIRQYALLNYGCIPKTKNDYEKYKNEIIEKRKPKYFLDNQAFLTMRDLAIYIEEKYKNPITMTEKRINKGATEKECIIPEVEYRILKSGTCKGKIEVIDTITNKKFIFNSTKDKELFKMFGLTTITEGIKTGLPVGGKRSKYKNPCLIKRI